MMNIVKIQKKKIWKELKNLKKMGEIKKKPFDGKAKIKGKRKIY